jgi:hypothetical protein
MACAIDRVRALRTSTRPVKEFAAPHICSHRDALAPPFQQLLTLHSKEGGEAEEPNPDQYGQCDVEQQRISPPRPWPQRARPS